MEILEPTGHAISPDGRMVTVRVETPAGPDELTGHFAAMDDLVRVVARLLTMAEGLRAPATLVASVPVAETLASRTADGSHIVVQLAQRGGPTYRFDLPIELAHLLQAQLDAALR